MKPYEIAQRLNDPKANPTMLIKKAWEADTEDFFVGLALATNPNIDFKVQSVPLIEDEEDEYPGALTFADFYDLALKLADGSLTGDDAKNAINEAAMVANAMEWNVWYRRILLKSLPKYLPMDTIQKELIRLTTE